MNFEYDNDLHNFIFEFRFYDSHFYSTDSIDVIIKYNFDYEFANTEWKIDLQNRCDRIYRFCMEV